nr:hypothetical protein [uncultured Mucilaginibacter sp.]
MKVQLRIIFGLLLLLAGYATWSYIVGSHKGKHVKLLYGLFEDNIPKGYPDTVFVSKTRIDTVYKDRSPLKKEYYNNIDKLEMLNQ